MKIKDIKTREQLWEYIDRELTDAEKEEIKRSDVYELHFGFGTWIRNTFIYSETVDIEEIIFGEEEEEPNKDGEPRLVLYHEDEMSSQIIKMYQEHLKQK